MEVHQKLCAAGAVFYVAGLLSVAEAKGMVLTAMAAQAVALSAFATFSLSFGIALAVTGALLSIEGDSPNHRWVFGGAGVCAFLIAVPLFIISLALGMKYAPP